MRPVESLLCCDFLVSSTLLTKLLTSLVVDAVGLILKCLCASFLVVKHFINLVQRRIQPVRLGEAILVIFGSQVLPRVHYCKRDGVYLTTLLCQNNERQNGLIS